MGSEMCIRDRCECLLLRLLCCEFIGMNAYLGTVDVKCGCIIEQLKIASFSSREISVKMKIVEGGRPTPRV